MGKRGSVFILVFAVFLVFSGVGYATTTVDIEKARDLISERNYEMATTLLEEIVQRR